MQAIVWLSPPTEPARRIAVSTAAVAGVRIEGAELFQVVDVRLTAEDRLSQRDRENCIVCKAAVVPEQREPDRLDGRGLVHRADDVPCDGTQHCCLPRLSAACAD